MFKWIINSLCVAVAVSLLAGCRVGSPARMLEPDMYRILHSKDASLSRNNTYVIDDGDSLTLVIPAGDQRRIATKATYQAWTFQRAAIDVDVFTIPFKIRPARMQVPPQINSNFEAALYLGRRIDLFNYRWKTITPTLAVRELQSRGFGYGVFAGLGSVAINEFVTRIPVGVEYEGIVLNAGIATIYDARVFNIGFALGFDNLVDANRQHWIYQRQPWFGVLFGLNLN